MPEEWEEVVRFAQAPHHSFQEIRDANPDRAKAQKALDKYLEQCKFENCIPQASYITSIGLKLPINSNQSAENNIAEDLR